MTPPLSEVMPSCGDKGEGDTYTPQNGKHFDLQHGTKMLPKSFLFVAFCQNGDLEFDMVFTTQTPLGGGPRATQIIQSLPSDFSIVF